MGLRNYQIVRCRSPTSRQSQRPQPSRSVQSHRSRPLRSWLIFDVRLGIMRRHECRSVSVKVDKRSEAFVFAAALGLHSPALFESKVLRSAHVRAGRFESSTRRSPRLRQDSAVLFRLERTHALRPEFLGTRISQVPNQSPEPTTTAVTICAEPQIAPAAVVAHL